MAAGHKNFRLRGGVDENDFPAREVSLKDIYRIGRSTWEKWGHMVSDYPIRNVISLVYAEGLYHGAMIALRDQKLRDTIGSNQSGDLSVAESASSSKTKTIERPTVRDLLE